MIKKIVRYVKKILKKIKHIFLITIPRLFFLVFNVPIIKSSLRKKGLKEIKKFQFKSWHLGYCYFTANYNNEKVFVKYNANKRIILHEIDNLKYILENSSILKNKIPKLILDGSVRNKGYFLVENFFECDTIENAISEKRNLDNNKIFNDFLTVLKEFQRIKFMHLDIKPNNVYINENNDIYFIDFGFSKKLDDNDFNYIGNKKTIKFVMNNLNKYSRIGIACIDDAVSFIKLSSAICPEFITEYHDIWLSMNKLSNTLYFDYEEVQYETEKSKKSK